MKIAWSPEAIEDLAAVRAYIADDDPAAARRVVLRIIDAIERLLVQHPDLGRPGRVPGTRELIGPRMPYVIPYRVAGEDVQILRVYHGARRWPNGF